MTRRRGTFIATTIAAAILVTLGLGARWDEWKEPTPETCKTDLEAVFDWCGIDDNSGCWFVDEEEVDEEEKDACEAGCVMAHCPEEVTCTELDPMWCGKSCADPQGARYWANLWGGHEACDGMHDHLPCEDGVCDLTQAQWNSWTDCIDTYIKQQCPEFTGWMRRRPPPDDSAE